MKTKTFSMASLGLALLMAAGPGGNVDAQAQDATTTGQAKPAAGTAPASAALAAQATSAAAPASGAGAVESSGRQRPVLTEAERETRRAERRARRQAGRREAQAANPAGGESASGATATTGGEAPSIEIGAKSAGAGGTAAADGSEAKGAKVAEVPKVDEKADLRLNFRGVPLDMVLNYLSEAAGFIIVLDTAVKGNVDVWSNTPLTRTEAVELLSTVLEKNGYSAIVNGRTLTVVTKEEARKRNVPVKTGANPQDIPKSEDVVTQILPVRFINAPQLIRDLQSLLPESAKVASNEGGNAIVITDSQVNIRRVAEIIAALDTTATANGALRVFPLKYADAKALSTTLRDLFQESNTAAAGGNRGGNQGGFGGAGGFPGGFGGFGGFGNRGGNTGAGGGRTSTSQQGPAAAKRVITVADEHSNSLIVSASEEIMPTIAQLIKSVDTDVQDLTELRVFTLKYSDPTEMADLLSNLFPDTTKTEDARGGGVRFGGAFPFGGGGGNRNGAAAAESDRMKKQGKVVAVPDARTSSVVVSAAKELMPQISAMVAQLDSNPARKQKVFVYSLENADATEVETVLRSLFESQNSRNTTANNQQNNALQNRANNANRQQGLNTTGQGGGGFGGNNVGGNR